MTRTRTWSYGSLYVVFYIYNNDMRETTFLSLDTGCPEFKRAHTVLPSCLYEFMPSVILVQQKLSISTGKKKCLSVIELWYENPKNCNDSLFLWMPLTGSCRWQTDCHFGKWLKEHWQLSCANILSIQMTHSLNFHPYKFTTLDLALTFLCGYPLPYTLSKTIPPTTMIRNIKIPKVEVGV